MILDDFFSLTNSCNVLLIIDADKILQKYLDELSNSQEKARMGAAMALGSQPKFMIQSQLMKVKITFLYGWF